MPVLCRPYPGSFEPRPWTHSLVIQPLFLPLASWMLPIPERISFDHLDTLGTIGPHIYHLPFQDTLLPWSRRWLWGLRSPPALDDATECVADYVSDQRVDVHGVHPVCPDSSPELIPAAEGMCSAFCLEEDAETAAAAAKVPHLSRLLVPLYHCLTATGSALQGPKTPRQQAGALFDSAPPHSLFASPAQAWRSYAGAL